MADLLNVPTDVFQTDLQSGKPQVRLNSQGETLPEVTTEPNAFLEHLEQLVEEQLVEQQLIEEQLAAPEAEVDFSLGDTPLSQPIDGLCPPTDDSQLEHKVISCGHVLKSTHDFARWSEKTGANRVNDFESLNCIDDLAVGQQLQTLQSDSIIDQEIGNLFGSDANQADFVQNEGWTQEQRGASVVIQSWPVLKSTHDAALWSEKRGSHSVNHEQLSAEVLDEIAINNQRQQRPRSWGPRQRPQMQWQAKGQATAQQGGGSQDQTQWQDAAQGGASGILHSWPVLKSTHDLASLKEKRGPNAVNNNPGASAVLEEIAIETALNPTPQAQSQQWQDASQGGAGGIINSWPVLKSTHDQALFSEKRGRNAVNPAAASASLEEIAQALPTQGIQGSSLQSGLDTQIRSHVQIDPEASIVETLDDDIMA